jgi:predicted nucleic acid-binding protein
MVSSGFPLFEDSPKKSSKNTELYLGIIFSKQVQQRETDHTYIYGATYVACAHGMEVQYKQN